MTVDRTITNIPFTVGPHSNGYWLVRDMDNKTNNCSKCSFGSDTTLCPTIHTKETCIDTDEEEVYLLCICFGDTVPAYFVEVTDDELN